MAAVIDIVITQRNNYHTLTFTERKLKYIICGVVFTISVISNDVRIINFHPLSI